MVSDVVPLRVDIPDHLRVRVREQSSHAVSPDVGSSSALLLELASLEPKPVRIVTDIVVEFRKLGHRVGYLSPDGVRVHGRVNGTFIENVLEQKQTAFLSVYRVLLRIRGDATQALALSDALRHCSNMLSSWAWREATPR